eukprot:Gb_32874 [translate_table: standard]
MASDNESFGPSERLVLADKTEKRLETLRQRKEEIVGIPLKQREVRIRMERMTTVLTLMSKELEVRQICGEVGLEYLCMNCGAFEYGQIEQQQALHEKGRLFELKDLVIKLACTEVAKGARAEGFPRAKMPDPWKGVVTVVNAVLLNNQHITSLFAPALRILAAIKYGELVDFPDFMKKRIERNIILWQEGKEYEIIYPGNLGGNPLEGGSKFSRREVEKEERESSYDREIEKIKAQAEELKEKRVEMALLRTEEVLRRQGLGSPTCLSETRKDLGESLTPELPIDSSFVLHEPDRRKTSPTSKKDQQDEIRALQNKLEEARVHFEEQIKLREKNVKLLQGRVSILEEELQVRRQESIEWVCMFQIVEQAEVKIQELEFVGKKLIIGAPTDEQLEKQVEDYKERLDATKEAISEMVGEEEKLRAKLEELEEITPKTVLPTAKIPINLANHQNDIRNLRVKLRGTEDGLEKAVELGFQIADCRAPSFVDPNEKNLIAEMFLTGAFALEDRTFPVNMREVPYEIRGNLGQGPKLGENLQAFIDLHEHYLKDFRGAEVYLQKLKDSVAEWHSKKQQLWDQSVNPIEQRINQLRQDAYLMAREPWNSYIYSDARYRVDTLANKVCVAGSKWIGMSYFPSPIFQPFIKGIGQESPL